MWGQDVIRGGYYIVTANVWYNDVRYQFDYEGWRAVTAHELGHLYGLNERYSHGPPIDCNPSEFTVMDSVKFDYSTNPVKVDGGCDVMVPLTIDKNRAKTFYDLAARANINTVKTGTNTMTESWSDVNYAESGYDLRYFYWGSDEQWHQFTTAVHYGGVAPGEPDSPTQLTSYFTRPSNMPVTYYMICSYTISTARVPIGYVCGQYKLLGA